MDRYKQDYEEALLFVRSQPDVKATVVRLLKARYELAKEDLVGGNAVGGAVAHGCRSLLIDLNAPDYRRPADG